MLYTKRFRKELKPTKSWTQQQRENDIKDMMATAKTNTPMLEHIAK